MWKVRVVNKENLLKEVPSKGRNRLVVLYRFWGTTKDFIIVDRKINSPDDVDEVIEAVKDYRVPIITPEIDEYMKKTYKNAVEMRKDFVKKMRNLIMGDLMMARDIFKVMLPKNELIRESRSVEVVIVYITDVSGAYRTMFIVRTKYMFDDEVEKLRRLLGLGAIVPANENVNFVHFRFGRSMYTETKEDYLELLGLLG